MQYTYLTKNSDAEYVSNSYNTKIRKTNDLIFFFFTNEQNTGTRHK